MEYTKLGRIRPVYKGAWSASAAYTALDIVKNAAGDRAYIAVKDVPKGTALTDAAYWAPVLDVSDVLNAADAAISAANEAARLAPKPLVLTEKSHPAVVWPEEGSLLRPTVSMLPIQSGSGDPSPDNVRPIFGRTEVTVTRCGKNLANVTYRDRIPSINNGLDVDAAGWASDYIHIGRNNVVLSITQVVADESFYLFLYDENKAFIGFAAAVSKDKMALKSADITGHENARYCRARLNAGAGTPSRLQLEVASEPTSFVPYQGETYTVSLGRTVYSGALNVQYGVLTITRAMVTLNGSEVWTAVPTKAGYRMQIQISDIVKAADNSVEADIICSDYKTITAIQSWNDDAYGVSQQQNTGDVFFNDAVYAASGDVAAWKAYLAGHPVQLCYRLAEPVVVRIDPMDIPALAGQNTVFSDGSWLDLTYNKSLVREHEELLARIAALEAAAVNNA